MLADDASHHVSRLREGDAAADQLGIEVVSVRPGAVELSLVVGPPMVNGHGILHGGWVFALADTAFAYCSASLGRLSVTRTADIAFAAPAALGDRISATAVVRAQYGRTTICDVTVTGAEGVLLAEFRGHGALRGDAVAP